MDHIREDPNHHSQRYRNVMEGSEDAYREKLSVSCLYARHDKTVQETQADRASGRLQEIWQAEMYVKT